MCEVKSMEKTTKNKPPKKKLQWSVGEKMAVMNSYLMPNEKM